MARRSKSKKARTTDLKLPLRNPVAANPLLGKSQAHGKTRKAERRADKVSVHKMPFDRATCFASSAGQVIGSNGILHNGCGLSASLAMLVDRPSLAA